MSAPSREKTGYQAGYQTLLPTNIFFKINVELRHIAIQLPHDDMTDHFGCSCSFWFGDLPVTLLASRASYALPPFARVRRELRLAEKDAGNKAGIVSITRRRYPLFHRAT
ncbi:hypothetical protein G3O00_01470 [Burkholderia sp. Ac-20384]|uniref:hypothetical protein n=1 Tax=Burkholderia sp. Ac-20384 TaxID=2703902 RepID=UPI00197E0681|nr:hypothetical protein [Burkholderia sp. Ac-20384]MBN3822287.1 hypothetical protein [Burkholderia sp. Ac-20384]